LLLFLNIFNKNKMTEFVYYYFLIILKNLKNLYKIFIKRKKKKQAMGDWILFVMVVESSKSQKVGKCQIARGGGPRREREGIRIYLLYINVVWRAEGQWSHCGWAPEPAIFYYFSKLGGLGSLTFGLPCWGVMYSPLKSIFAFTLRHNNN
jgi:hypothetical protein